MSEIQSCERFQDLLDLRAAGRLDGAGEAALAAHAAGCPDCALLLRVQEALALPPPADLAEQVPDALVAGMWPRVESALADRPGAAPAPRTWAPWVGRRRRSVAAREASRRQRLPVLVPLLAAATLALALLSGYLLGQNRQLQGRERHLAGELARQERLVNGFLQVTSDLVAERQPASPAPGASPAADGWRRALAGGEPPTLGELTALLDRLPPETTLLSPRDAGRLAWQRPAWKSLAARVDGTPLRTGDGLQAIEVLTIVRSLRLAPEATIPARWWTALAGADPSRLGAVARRPVRPHVIELNEEREP